MGWDGDGDGDGDGDSDIGGGRLPDKRWSSRKAVRVLLLEWRLEWST